MSLLNTYNNTYAYVTDPRLNPQVLSLSGSTVYLSGGGGEITINHNDIKDSEGSAGIAGQVLTSAGDGKNWYWGAGGEAGGISAIKVAKHLTIDSNVPTAPVISFDISSELDMKHNDIINCKNIITSSIVCDNLVCKNDKFTIGSIASISTSTSKLHANQIIDKSNSAGAEGTVLSSTSAGLAWVQPPVYVSSVTAGANITLSGSPLAPIVELASPLNAPLHLGTQHISADNDIHIDKPTIIDGQVRISAESISKPNILTFSSKHICIDAPAVTCKDNLKAQSISAPNAELKHIDTYDIHSTTINTEGITIASNPKSNKGSELHFMKMYESDSLITTVDKPTYAGETAFLVNKGIPLANKIKHISDDAAYCACSYNNAIYVGCHSNVYKIVGSSIVMRFIVEGTVKVMSVHNKELWIGGSFSNIASVKASNIAIIGNDDTVRPVCDNTFQTEGLNGEVMSFCSSSAGMYIGGVFNSSASGLLPMPLHNVALFETTGFNTVFPMMCIAKQPVAELSVEGNYLFVGSELKYDTVSQMTELSAKQGVKPVLSAGLYPISSSTTAVIQSLELYIIADSVKGIDIYTHTDATTFVSDNLAVALPQTGSTCTLKASKDLTRWWIQSLYL